jgi:putative endonuclease
VAWGQLGTWTALARLGRTPTKDGYVYMMANQRNGTLYLGVTSDLAARAYQHRNKLIGGFSKKYGCVLLVWFEGHGDIDAARYRELQMKKWKREWKIELIERHNPQWKDLYETLF